MLAKRTQPNPYPLLLSRQTTKFRRVRPGEPCLRNNPGSTLPATPDSAAYRRLRLRCRGDLPNAPVRLISATLPM
jgi:hypothetical protein